jgi:protein TonB
MSITVRWVAVRVLPVAASLLLHAVAYGGIMLIPAWVSVRERVLLAELVQPDPEPPAPTAQPAPKPKPDRRRLKLPKPIETPMPKLPDPPVETAKVEPEPPPPAPARVVPTPAPVVPAPAPVVPAPASPTPAPAAPAMTVPEPAPRPPSGRGPLAPADAPLTTAGEGLPTQAGPPAAARPGPSVAALPPDGITQTATPRGGYQVKPSYPSSARRAGIQGTTLLSVFVAADGRVAEVVVKQSAGHPDLDAAAADAVRRWRFEPARRGNEPVSMWVLLPVEFRLR